jgi:hypothetical protein
LAACCASAGSSRAGEAEDQLAPLHLLSIADWAAKRLLIAVEGRRGRWRKRTARTCSPPRSAWRRAHLHLIAPGNHAIDCR